jgi:hypothetical protein
VSDLNNNISPILFNNYVNTISKLLSTISTNNFTSYTVNYNKLNNTIHDESNNILHNDIKYLKTDIVSINHINNWFIIDEYIYNDVEYLNFNSINKYSNSLNNYTLSNYIMLELYYNDIIISIIFNKNNNDYINITIEFDMKANIKSNIIHKYIDSIIYILQSIDTSLVIIE